MQLDPKAIKSILKKDDPVVLELGAHTGLDTRRFLNEFSKIIIYCFEPDPRCIKAFKNLIKDKRAVLIEAAVSNRDGWAMLNMSSGWPSDNILRHFKFLGLNKLYISMMGKQWNYSSSIKTVISNATDHPWLIFPSKVKVQTIQLDLWIKKNGISAVDFIWSDVQGAEKDVFEGAAETLKICKYFYTEYGEVSTYPEALTREQIVDFFERNNYVLVPEYSSENKIGNLLFRNMRL
ncbi:MAG TPA: FkbM family methyltransferase [Candidatus Omnitrophota bacterium]|nr:FkbM family methyltransferase [Candidatus Omnitrophota bacterium]HPS36516.1 FkbM family methyltransferase [Candidatus Omnitrophota bacterium]